MIFHLIHRCKKPAIIETPQEVLDSKKAQRKASDAVVENTRKIQSILDTDHVTLRIRVATQGGKNG